MDTGSAPDIRRRPHRTRKWRPAADDLGRRFLLFKSPNTALAVAYPLDLAYKKGLL
jgi:hypothetical protein